MAKKEFEWVLVEAVDTFRMRYVVQVPKGKDLYALDTVTMHEAKEFSQEHMDEIIVSHRVMSEKEAIALCLKDNDYSKNWNDDHIIETFFTKDGEKVQW